MSESVMTIKTFLAMRRSTMFVNQSGIFNTDARYSQYWIHLSSIEPQAFD